MENAQETRRREQASLRAEYQLQYLVAIGADLIRAHLDQSWSFMGEVLLAS